MSNMEKHRKLIKEARERIKIENAQFEEIMNKTIDPSRFEDEVEVEDYEAD